MFCHNYHGADGLSLNSSVNYASKRRDNNSVQFFFEGVLFAWRGVMARHLTAGFLLSPWRASRMIILAPTASSGDVKSWYWEGAIDPSTLYRLNFSCMGK